MKQAIPCHHCGRLIRAVSVPGHPYRHVESGVSACAPVTHAQPAPGYEVAA